MADGNLWRDRNKVFVAGLPLHVDDDALYDKFKAFGEMHQSKVVYDQKTGRSRGFGFLNQSKWEKRTLNVRFLQPKNGSSAGGNVAVAIAKRPTKVIGLRPEGCTTIYVGNLAYDITEEVLRKVFDKCGSIRAVRFAEHIQTKEFRGFGYVQFHEEGPCEEAVKLDGMVVMARDEGYAQAREELQKKLKKGVCHKFQQGQCTRGDACKFAHVMQDQDAKTEPESAGPVMEQTQATSDAPVCINFQKGKCKRGAACKFQHLHGNGNDEKTLEESENVKMETAEEEATPEEEETRADEGAPVCQNYQKGKCKRGAACRFRHVAAPAGGYQEPEDEGWKAPVRVALPVAAVAEVAAAPATAVEEVSEYQKRFQSICYNWQRTGSCERGDNCPFQHDGAPALKSEEVVLKSVKKEKKHKKRKATEEEEAEDDENAKKKHKKHKKDKKEKKHKKHKKHAEESD
ncbi:Nucleotide-binding alpha-beta plait domain [Phytophthora cactorum]|nr:Nucleotide-binding alpha-beta plait domain [Phytophthora cactorum]